STPTGPTRSPSTPWPWATGCCARAGAPRPRWPTWRAGSSPGSGGGGRPAPRARAPRPPAAGRAPGGRAPPPRRTVAARAAPALSRLLGFLGVDEQAHHSFFLKAVRLFLGHDRPGTLAQLYRVLHHFAMPSIYEMADGPRRVEAIKALGVFNDRLYFDEVYRPVLAALGVSRPELRRAAPGLAPTRPAA